MPALFTISTSHAHRPYHILRLDLDEDYALEIHVKRSFEGGDVPEYRFTPYLANYSLGDPIELVTNEEHLRRCLHAEENGDIYAPAFVERYADLASGTEAWKVYEDVVKKFLALVALDIFSLPVTIR